MSNLTRIEEVLEQITNGEYVALTKISDGNFRGHVVTLDPTKLKAIDIDAWVPGSSDPVIPPMGAEKWVQAKYTDEWVWSDGEQHGFGYYDENWEFIFNWTNENMPADNVEITIDGDSILSQESEYPNNFRPIPYSEFKTTTKVEVNLTDDLVLTGYRKFTPAHWEDADGNWTNGNWGEWTMTDPYGSISNNVIWAEESEKDNFGGRYNEWIMDWDTSSDINSNDINACILYTKMAENAYVATRTWNNTKPEA